MSTTAPVRWYREPFVWLLIALPATAVVAGFTTLWLAIRSDDGLVEDDYYRKGQEINRVLDRDHTATRLGLESTLDLDTARHALEVRLRAHAPMTPPAQLEVKFLYGTRAGLDQVVILPRGADGAYRASLPALAPGHWNVQLAAQDWRLLGSLRVPGAQTLVIHSAGS